MCIEYVRNAKRRSGQIIFLCRMCGNFLYLTPNEKGTLTQSFASYISWLKMQKKYCQIVLFSLKTFTEGLISSTQVCFDFLLMSSYIHGIKSPNNESCFPEFFSSNFSQFEQSKRKTHKLPMVQNNFLFSVCKLNKIS